MVCQLLIIRLYFAVTICLILSVLQPGKATVTLTAPSSPPCFGQTYKLTCTYPVRDGDTFVGWERNGTGLDPTLTSHNSDDNATTATLMITLIKEEFGNENISYQCYTFNRRTLTTTNSNKVFLDPPELPTGPVTEDVKGSNAIYCNWAKSNETCFNITGYECVIKNNGSVVQMHNVSGPSVNFTGLSPQTTYNISISAVDGEAMKSSPKEMQFTTLSNITLEVMDSTPENVKLMCQHHNRNGKDEQNKPIFFKSNTLWIHDDDSFNESPIQTNDNSEVVSVNGEGTVEIKCAMELRNGIIEESNTVAVSVRPKIIPSESANIGLIIGIAVVVLIVIVTTVLIIIVYYKKCYQKNQKCQPESDSETKDMEINNPKLVDKALATDKLNYADLTFTGREPVHSDNEMYKVEYATTRQA